MIKSELRMCLELWKKEKDAVYEIGVNSPTMMVVKLWEGSKEHFPRPSSARPSREKSLRDWERKTTIFPIQNLNFFFFFLLQIIPFLWPGLISDTSIIRTFLGEMTLVWPWALLLHLPSCHTVVEKRASHRHTDGLHPTPGALLCSSDSQSANTHCIKHWNLPETAIWQVPDRQWAMWRSRAIRITSWH